MKRLHLPLSALRAFEVAARHESFAAAARELAITQPAVSKHIIALEEWLGSTLFERGHRYARLTPQGHRLAARLSDAFDRMSVALEAAQAEAQPHTRLTIAVESDFAHLWLLPRLPDFEACMPGLSVEIVAQVDPVDLNEGGVDCAVLWGGGWWKDCASQPLFTNLAFPVCEPELGDRLRADRSTLHDMRLIHDRTLDWWKRAAIELDMPDLDWTAGTIYNQTSLCLEAAARGDGITIGDEVSSRYYLEEGTLVIPFDLLLTSPTSYYFLWRGQADAPPALLAFREWLIRQATEHRQWMADYWQRARVNTAGGPAGTP